MEKLNAVICCSVASDNTIDHIKSSCSSLNIKSVYTNLNDLINSLINEKPSVVFTEIKIQNQSVFKQFNQSIWDLKKVVLISKDLDHVHEAIKYNCFDYLLKPLNKNSLYKLNSKIEKIEKIEKFNNYNFGVKRKLSIPTQDGLQFINPDQIFYCKAKGPYSKIYFSNNQHITTSKTLKELQCQLSPFEFLRTHRSYLINTEYIKHYLKANGGFILLDNDISIPISRRMKKEVLEQFSAPFNI